MNPEDKIRALETQVADLKRRLDAVAGPNLSPDFVNNLIRAGFLKFEGIDVTTFTNPSGLDFRGLFFQFQNKFGVLSYEPKPFYVRILSINLSTNTFTAPNHGFSDGNDVSIITTDTPPAPLTTASPNVYYVRDATADTFKLTDTPGGSAIDITNLGSGIQFIRAL